MTKQPFAILVLLACAATAPAAIIFDNGTPDFNAPNSRGITIFRSADDFTIGTASTIDSVRFWMVAEPGDFTGTLTYAIYLDSAGFLGTVVNTATVNGVTPVLLNPIPANIHSMYEVSFAIPGSLALGAGTYWLELHDGATLTTGNDANVLWAIVNGVSGNARQSANPTIPTGATVNALAFQLEGATSTNAVPEPQSLVITLLGLAAVGGLLHKRRA